MSDSEEPVVTVIEEDEEELELRRIKQELRAKAERELREKTRVRMQARTSYSSATDSAAKTAGNQVRLGVALGDALLGIGCLVLAYFLFHSSWASGTRRQVLQGMSYAHVFLVACVAVSSLGVAALLGAGRFATQHWALQRAHDFATLLGRLLGMPGLAAAFLMMDEMYLRPQAFQKIFMLLLAGVALAHRLASVMGRVAEGLTYASVALIFLKAVALLMRHGMGVALPASGAAFSGLVLLIASSSFVTKGKKFSPVFGAHVLGVDVFHGLLLGSVTLFSLAIYSASQLTSGAPKGLVLALVGIAN